MMRSLRTETKCLWLDISSLCDAVPITCSSVLPLCVGPWPSCPQIHSSSFPAGGLALKSWFPRLLYQPSTLFFSPVGCTGKRMEDGEKGRARVFCLLPINLLSQGEALSLPWPLAHDDSSFSQVTLALGHLVQFRGGSNFPQLLTSGAPPGHLCIFLLFYLMQPILYIKFLLF